MPRPLRHPAAGLLLALCIGCTGRPAPNVLLVTFDTTRYDRFGVTGDPEARTPTVDALARRGLVFDHAYASVALTLPSHTTMLTGLEPLAHGVRDNGRFVVPEALETLAERLGSAGWDTAAFVSAFVLERRYRLDQGFAVYDDETRTGVSPLDFSVPSRPGAEVTDGALAWLRRRDRGRPFFLWAHYYDPHLPREVDAAFDAIPDRYAAEIAYADAQLGRLLDGIAAEGDARDTLVVFTADHGEGLGEHGEETHGILAYDSTLHVPLVLAGPGVPRGARSRILARHVDIVPTVLARVGIAAPGGLAGRDLVQAAARPGDDDEVVGWFESHGPAIDLGWAAIEGVRTSRWKYTAAPAPRELYDVRADPRETRNVLDAEPAVGEAMEARLLSLRSGAVRPAAARRTSIDVEEAERLAALGYVEVAAGRPGTPPPDPRRFAEVRDWIDHARSIAAAGGYAAAVDALETLAHGPSVRPLVLRTLAPVYAEMGRVDDAVAAFREYIALTGAAEASLGLARAYLGAGRPADALATLDAAPHGLAGAAVLRAHALARVGRHAEARAAVDAAYPGDGESAERPRRRKRAALVVDVAPIADGEAELRALVAATPDDPVLWSWLGYYLAVWGPAERHAEALDLVRRAAREAPDDADLQANFGWTAARLGRDADAVVALEAALARDPRRSLERYRLAVVLHRSGHDARALDLVRTAVAVRPAASWSADARALLHELEQNGGGR